MLCQKCGLKNATVHLTKIYNDQKTELNLCKDCAERYTDKPLTMNMNFGMPKIGLDDIIAGFFGMNPIGDNKMGTRDSTQQIKSCDFCHTTLADVRETGKVGCAKCYSVFKDELMPVIKKVHGTTHHVGHSPNDQEHVDISKEVVKENPYVEEMNKLKAEMSESVAKEDYENCAVLRDKIKELENKMNDKDVQKPDDANTENTGGESK